MSLPLSTPEHSPDPKDLTIAFPTMVIGKPLRRGTGDAEIIPQGLARRYCCYYTNIMSSNNVQFSVAVHIMQVLHVHSEKRVISSFITESVNTDAGTVRTLLSRLAKAGLVLTTRGRGGSSALARPADQISLLDIHNAVTSQPVFLIHGHPVQRKCTVSTHHKQTMRVVLADCQRAFEASLAERRLTDIVNPMRRVG